MRNLLAFLASVAMTVGAVGWYLGWYQVGTNSADRAHPRVMIDINTPKIGHDLHKLEEKVENKLGEHGQQTVAAPGTPAVQATTGTVAVPDLSNKHAVRHEHHRQAD